MDTKALYQKACRLIPGGVNSPVRSFSAVGVKPPIFAVKAEGAFITDALGNRYIDYIGSWGPMLFGHNDPAIITAAQKAITLGSSFGLPTPLEVELAEKITQLMPSIQMVRLTVSGTEAAMSAVRLARAYTKKNLIVKCAGCYHGHSDSLLSGGAGSGMLTAGLMDSNGIPAETAQNTLTVPYNDLEAAEKALKTGKTAAFIVEPVPANMGLVLPAEGYLSGLKKLCTQYGALLIFDEVISGFRLSSGGAQQVYNVAPDLTILGKIIGGGFPIGAFGGKKEIMSLISPQGPVYHAGTLSGSPVASSAGIAMLSLIAQQKSQLYPLLAKNTEMLANHARKMIQKYNIPAVVQQTASLFTIFFTKTPVHCLEDAKKCDTMLFAAYFRAMLAENILIPMSQFEAHFVSAAHDSAILDKTCAAIEKSFYELTHA